MNVQIIKDGKRTAETPVPSQSSWKSSKSKKTTRPQCYRSEKSCSESLGSCLCSVQGSTHVFLLLFILQNLRIYNGFCHFLFIVQVSFRNYLTSIIFYGLNGGNLQSKSTKYERIHYHWEPLVFLYYIKLIFHIYCKNYLILMFLVFRLNIFKTVSSGSIHKKHEILYK